jgi:hypothetical protein
MASIRYEKPRVMNLSARAEGSTTFSCIPGGSAGAYRENCITGTGADTYCNAGTSGFWDTAIPCTTGNGVAGGDCVAGITPGMGLCEGGSSGFNPNGCAVGPSA